MRRFLQTSNLHFLQVDDPQVIGFVKESVGDDNAVAAAIALTGEGPRQFWFHFGDIADRRRRTDRGQSARSKI